MRLNVLFHFVAIQINFVEYLLFMFVFIQRSGNDIEGFYNYLPFKFFKSPLSYLWDFLLTKRVLLDRFHSNPNVRLFSSSMFYLVLIFLSHFLFICNVLRSIFQIFGHFFNLIPKDSLLV